MIVLIVGMAVLFLLFVAGCNVRIFSSFKKEQKIVAILAEAQRLYDSDRKSEAVDLLEKALGMIPLNSKYLIEALRQRGWTYYHLAIRIKESNEQKENYLVTSLISFESVMLRIFRATQKQKISIFNGHPLVLWLLDEKDKAKQISNNAIELFPNEPSVWNTRAILLRWEKNFEESIDVCEKVAITAEAKEDYRTAGSGKQNKGDALRALGRNTEAKMEYEMALAFYKKSEDDRPATIHIVDGVQRKILELS